MNPKTAVLALTAFAASLISSLAQGDNILVTDGKFVPVISFMETHTEKVARRRDSTDVAVIGRFAARIVANLANFDLTELSEDTSISVSIGDFQFDATIADLLPVGRDGNSVPYSSKITGGTYYIRADKLDRNGDPIYKRNGDPVQVKVGAVGVAWTATTLTINVAILDTEQAEVGGVLDTLNLIGLADDGSKGGTINFANEAVPVSVTFGSASGESFSYARGFTKTAYKNVRGEVLTLNSAGAAGAADMVAPVLVVTVPADDAGSGYVDFAGTVTDLAAGTLPDSTSGQFVEVEVYLNDPDFAAPIPADDVSDPDKAGKRTFSFTGIPLDSGENTIVIVATDDSGNQIVITKKVNSTGSLPVN
ncbi:MAG: hypothetical protein WCF18_03895 [Chthoniobacteraceae bacterium]